jgi:hypothetical protein
VTLVRCENRSHHHADVQNCSAYIDKLVDAMPLRINRRVERNIGLRMPPLMATFNQLRSSRTR